MLSAVAIAFVDHENIGDLHDARFDGLHVVTHARHQYQYRDIGQTHDVHFILAHAHRLNHNQIATRSVEHSGHVGRGTRQSAERTARCHASNINPRVGKMFLHADAVTQNCSAGVRAGGIDGDNAYAAIFLAIKAGKLIDQRALPRPRRSSEAEDARLAAVRKQFFQQIRPSWSAVFDYRDNSRQGADVAGAELVTPCLDFRAQTISLKQRAWEQEIADISPSE